MDSWRSEILALIETARQNADGCNWVWSFRAIDLARRHITVPYGILGNEDKPDLDALEKVVRNADTASTVA